MMSEIKLLLIEDNAADARLLTELCKEVPEVQLRITHVTRLDRALELLGQESFDVSLVDLGLPDAQGLHAVNTLLEKSVRFPVIVLSGLSDESIALQAVREGAQDYIVKGRFSAEGLIKTMRYAIERYQLLLKALQQQGPEHANTVEEADPALELLTQREKEVFELLVQGLTNQEIAKQLFVSNHTVKNHVTKIFQKYNIFDRHQLIYAYFQGRKK
jgi:DNA-binding NarL/FixJ family response regulator